MNNELDLFFKSRLVTLDSYRNEDSIDYRKNKELLKNETGNPVSVEEFKVIIKKELFKFIYPFENIVVLAGAGASIVNKDGQPDNIYGHTVFMLAKAIDENLENRSDLFTIDEIIKMCKYDKPIKIQKDEKSEKVYNSEFILEDFLSKMFSYEEFIDDSVDKDKFNQTKKFILDIIKNKTSYSFQKGIHKHDSFIKILTDMIKSPSRLSIITTNYDTLFEEAADDLNFTIMDGFSFTSKPKFDVDLFDWSLVKRISNVKSDKVEYKKNILNILKIHGSLTWKLEGDEVLRVNKEDNKDPLMIFPSSNKYYHSYEKPYFELLSKFQELIKAQSTLFITTGFSFSDNHIAKMITQSIKSNPSLTLLVTDYSISGDKNGNWLELEKLMENGYNIAFLKGTIDSGLSDYFGVIEYED